MLEHVHLQNVDCKNGLQAEKIEQSFGIDLF